MQIEFNDRDIAVICHALGFAPYRDAAPVLASIQMQLQKLQAAKNSVAVEPKDDAVMQKPSAPSGKKTT